MHRERKPRRRLKGRQSILTPRLTTMIQTPHQKSYLLGADYLTSPMTSSTTCKSSFSILSFTLTTRKRSVSYLECLAIDDEEGQLTRMR